LRIRVFGFACRGFGGIGLVYIREWSNLSKSSQVAVKELKVDWSIIYILESSLTWLKNYRAAILLQNLQQNQLCDSQIQNQIPQLLHRFHSFAIPKYNASTSVIPQLLQLCVLYFVTKKKKKKKKN
jgi:hypothetical protein